MRLAMSHPHMPPTLHPTTALHHPRSCPPLLVLLLLLLAFSLSCSLSLAASISTTTSTSPSIVNDYTITSTPTTPTLSSSTHVLTSTTFLFNEAPNIPISLPFTFPYWTAQTSIVYATPNGAIQFDDGTSCCTPCETSQGSCCQFMNYNSLIETSAGPVSTCSFALSYNDLLAPFLTDLSPAYPTPMVNGPQLVYGYNRDALTFTTAPNSTGPQGVWNANYPFIIQYKNIPLNGQSEQLGYPFLPAAGVAMTFGVGLYSTGRIDFYYWNVSDPVNYDGWGGLERLLLVGLRQSQGQSQQNTYVTQYYDPNTGVLPSNGTYIPRTGVKNNMTWVFWPIGSSSCVGPQYAVTNGGSMLRIVVKDYINSTGNFNWTCRFIDDSTNRTVSGGDVAGVYNVFDDEIDCMAPGATVNATYSIELLVSTLSGLVQLPIDPLSYMYVANHSRQADSLTAPTTSIQSLGLFCTSCAAFRPSVCWYDCYGTLHGSAYIDNCGTCVGGNTGRTFDDALDCNGVCHGPFVQLGDGECVCAGGGECDTIVESILYMTDQYASYIYTINGSVLSGNTYNTSIGAINESSNGGDSIIDFDDERFIGLPYTFTITSDPFPFYLNFYFPFMGYTYNLIYISPMGGIYLNVPSTTCIAHASLAHFDGTNNCQYQMIAGYMAEFDYPSVSSYVTPDWSYITNSKYFVVRYSNMHLAEASDARSYVSFSITLYPTGRVSINHYDVIPADEIASVWGLPYMRELLVGLVTAPRSTSDMELVYPSPFIALSQRGNGLFALGVEQQWRTTTVSTGVYPLQSIVRASQTIDFLPIGINVCVSPYFGPATGGQIMHINPQLTSPYLQYFTLACTINNQFYPATYNTTYQSYDCVLPAGLPDTAVTVGLGVWDTLTYITTNRVYYEYYNASDMAVAGYNTQYSTDSFCDHCYNAQLNINTRYCYVDCADDWRGGAYLDDCGSCVGGLTGQLPDEAKDCYGTCFGAFHTAVTVDGDMACVCQLSANQTTRQSGCSNVPVMRPAATVYYQYIDGFTAAADNTPLSVTASNNSSLILLPVDAAELIALDLDFSFPWFGASYRRVYIDEYGAIFLTNTTATCQSYGSTALWQNSTTCLYSLIAAAFTPDYAPLPTTAYSVTASTLSVVWTDGNQSFSLTLDSGGGIAVDYRDVIDSGNEWIVGVRLGVPALLMPFPFFITAASYTSYCGVYTCVYNNLPSSYMTPNELSYLPGSTYTSGYYPTRSRFAAATNGRLSFCPFNIEFCHTPQSGLVRGGTLVTFYNSATTCNTVQGCCYLNLNVTCSWGGIIVPANYSLPLQSFQCAAPAGVRNGVVSVWLEESGRRIGMAAPLFYTYNDSTVLPQSSSDVELLTCVNCASVLSTYCWQDCTGTYRGNATNDTCGVCQPPTLTTAVTMASYVATAADFPYQSALDCMGVCYGPFGLYNQSASHFLPDSSPLPQCGCTVQSESSALQRYAFPYTVLCAVWAKVEGSSAVRDTLNALNGYQIFILVLVLIVLVCALYVETVRWVRYVKRRMKMTPAERDRERRRRERRRQRERERRERRRRLELGLPLPHQQALPPGVAAMPVAPPPPATDAPHTPPATANITPSNTAAAAVTAPPTSGGRSGSAAGTVDGLTAAERNTMNQLHAMGFNDDSVLLPLIRKCRGDANAVINQLLR